MRFYFIKIYFIVLTVATLSQPLFCQNLDKLLQPTPFSSSLYAINISGTIYLEQQEFSTLFSALPKSIKILKLDLDLNILDSINLNNVLGVDSNLFKVAEITQIGTDSILILSRTLNNIAGIQYSETYGIVTTNNFIVIDTFRIKPFNNTFSCGIEGLVRVGQTLIIGGAKTPNGISIIDGYVAEIDFSGNILNEIIIPHTLLGIANPALSVLDVSMVNNTIIATFDNPSISFFYAAIDSFTTISPVVYGSSAGAMSPFVQLLDMPNKPPLVYSITGAFGSSPPIDSTHDGFFEYLSLITLDSVYGMARQDTFTFTWDNVIPHQGGPYTPQTYLGTIDYYQNPDSTTFGATDMYSLNYLLAARAINLTYLHNVNANTGAPNWHKVYRNGYSHNLTQVVALPGNQTLLVFNENNWDRLGYDNIAIRLIIIDGNGNPIGVPEAEQQILQLALHTYPNPTQNEVRIGGLPQSGNFSYYLNNALGQAVQQGTLSASQNSLQIGNLPSGTYNLAVVNAQGFGQATKIVKQ